jgi:hypothetical protein
LLVETQSGRKKVGSGEIVRQINTLVKIVWAKDLPIGIRGAKATSLIIDEAINMEAKRKCPICGNLYLIAKSCTGTVEMCHLPAETEIIKTKVPELEK